MRGAAASYFLGYLEPERLVTKYLQNTKGQLLVSWGLDTIHFSFGSSVPWNEPLTITINTRHSASGAALLMYWGVWSNILFDMVN